MKKIFILLLLISTAQPQTNNLHSSENIKKFADHLFSEKDFLRSVFEYEKLPLTDTISFKIALAYREMGDYNFALQKFSIIKEKSALFNKAQKEYYKTLLLSENYDYLQKSLKDAEGRDFQRLLYLSYLFNSDILPDQEIFMKPFPSSEKENLLYFYYRKKNPPYKSPFLSGLLSALIPGSGKIYSGETGDGITAFITTSLLSFLSYNNFTNNHQFRGWLFAGLGFFFYAGNVYGSVSSAQIYNAEIEYKYNAGLKEYLQKKKYFLSE